MTSIAILQATLRLVAASWRGQLALLAIGTMLLAATLADITSTSHLALRIVLVCVVLVLLVGFSARAAFAQDEDVLEVGRAVDELIAVLARMPRLLVQVAVAALPAAVAVLLALQLTSALAVLGLVLIPIAFVVVVLCAGPVLVSIVVVMRGEQTWLPRSAYAAIRPAAWRVALDVFVGAVVSMLAALPLVLVGFVITANVPVLGAAGAGLGAAAALPWLGCWSVALWRSLGSPLTLADAVVEQVGAATVVESAFGAPEPAWVEGPTWDVAVEAGAVWGTWIRIEGAGSVGLRVAYSGTVAPDLLLCGEGGDWWRPGVLTASGEVIATQLEAGNTYLQVGAIGPVAQAVSVTMLVPGASVAA